VPLFLLPETKRAERDALRELEERFDADVSLTDLREALVRAGLEHLDDVESELEEWGYGMTFDEP
jgi:predicted nuclease with TOPRIM domain